MSWVPLALATALFYGLQGAWSKRVTRDATPLAASWAIFAFAFPPLLFYLGLRGLPEIQPAFWPAAAVTSGLSLLSFYLYVSALQRGELGLTYPLLALTPLFLVPVEWVLLGDLPGLRQSVGILAVVAGVYLLHLPGERAGPFAPFRALFRDPGSRRMLAVALIWSVSAVVDKIAVTSASTPFYGVVLSGVLGLAFLPLVSRKGGGVRAALGPDTRWLLVVQGLLFAATFIVQMEALRQTLAAYVITTKRSGALVTVLLGAAFFGERGTGKRLVGTAVILLGLALVVTA